jgi:hypothetical protein
MPYTTYYLRGLNQQGTEVFYTGLAGDAWVSRNRAQAIHYGDLAAARGQARQFNRAVSEHGVWFLTLGLEDK